MAKRSRDMESLLNVTSIVSSRLVWMNNRLDAMDRNLYDLNNRVSELVMRRNGHKTYRAFRIPTHRDEPAWSGNGSSR